MMSPDGYGFSGPFLIQLGSYDVLNLLHSQLCKKKCIE